MLGKFVYSNPTKLYFGENSLENLPTFSTHSFSITFSHRSALKSVVAENAVRTAAEPPNHLLFIAPTHN